MPKANPPFFHRFLNRNKTSKEEAPPPYHSTSAFSSKIKAKHTPQWRWSNHQCKEWITAVLVTYLNLPLAEAEAKASQFEGFGPSLFERDHAWWEWFLGDGVGSPVFSLIFSLRDEPGALPEGITYDHYKRSQILGGVWFDEIVL
ncbi:hypothetical protein HYALB_00011477 [Hymenoscyphus albidus]|uniref:Uncharacterized protein n=1 Tax=Hymenoscyphus albidus TaxID=595503 RepID=A0A9N9LPU3_9HELO|nr:hypothetical protein HYALB_00011477 [Hymenoscyphus albidus]